MRFGNFAADGDDLCYDPPTDENKYYFDFTTFFGYSKDDFSEDIQKSMDAGDLSYLFASYDVDIACPDSVLKDCSKDLLNYISFGALSLRTMVCFRPSCAVRLGSKKLKWKLFISYSLKHLNMKLGVRSYLQVKTHPLSRIVWKLFALHLGIQGFTKSSKIQYSKSSTFNRTPGASAIKKLYSKEDWESCNWRRVLATRKAYSGPDWTQVGVTERGWGGCYYVNDGEQLLFGVSLQTLLMSFSKSHGKGSPVDVDGADIEMLGDYFSELPVQDLVGMGGFYIHLKKGQGIVIPPLYIVGFVNSFQLRHPPMGEAAEETVANVLDSRC